MPSNTAIKKRLNKAFPIAVELFFKTLMHEALTSTHRNDIPTKNCTPPFVFVKLSAIANVKIHGFTIQQIMGVGFDKYIQKIYPKEGLYSLISDKLKKYGITLEILSRKSCKLYYYSPDFLYTDSRKISFFDRRSRILILEDGSKKIEYSPCALFAYWAKYILKFPQDLIRLIVSMVSL